MTIIKIDPLESGLHPIESQSHRREVWLEGYIEVPARLEEAVWATGGYCNLIIEDGVLTGIESLPIPEPIANPSAEITALKAELTATDYKAIKYAEGWLTEEEYAPIKAQRQSIRDEINTLEAVGSGEAKP